MRNYILSLLILTAISVGCCTASLHPFVGPPEIVVVPDSWNAEDFSALVDVLGEECGLNADVSLQVLSIDDYLGLTWWDEERGHYRIQIEGAQQMSAILDSLIHEWAHAMVWDASQRPGDQGHGPLWGVAYARCYRVMLTVIAPDGPAPAPSSVLVPPSEEKLEAEPEVSDTCFRLRSRVTVQLAQ